MSEAVDSGTALAPDAPDGPATGADRDPEIRASPMVRPSRGDPFRITTFSIRSTSSWESMMSRKVTAAG